jgi:rhodanese-related sulfurtransferase
MTNEITVLECSAQDAWQSVQANEQAYIVDVRTAAEWANVGAPNLGDLFHKLHFISWQMAPDMRINPDFLEKLAAAQIPATAKLYFLCRSGVRSLAAARAAAAAGYAVTVNIAAGFEGIAGADGQRHGGWLGFGLPAAPHKAVGQK